MKGANDENTISFRRLSLFLLLLSNVYFVYIFGKTFAMYTNMMLHEEKENSWGTL